MDRYGHVHIGGIRRWTVDLDIDNPKYEEYIEDMSLKMGLIFREGFGKYKVKKVENMWVRDMELGYQKA